MLPDRASNPGPLTYESGALPIALRGPASYEYSASNVHEGDTIDTPYFFVNKTAFFSFQNNPKNLDPSFKTDPDFRTILKGKTYLTAEFHKTTVDSRYLEVEGTL